MTYNCKRSFAVALIIWLSCGCSFLKDKNLESQDPQVKKQKEAKIRQALETDAWKKVSTNYIVVLSDLTVARRSKIRESFFGRKLTDKEKEAEEAQVDVKNLENILEDLVEDFIKSVLFNENISDQELYQKSLNNIRTQMPALNEGLYINFANSTLELYKFIKGAAQKG